MIQTVDTSESVTTQTTSQLLALYKG